MRAVMFYEGDSSGMAQKGSTDGTSLLAVATKSYTIHYTGSYDYYSNINLIPKPEEVIVQSYIPQVVLGGYTPPRWTLDKPEEYFEVTRRITPDEWGFWLTNNVTGEKLNPYSWHKQNENMSKEEYQKKIDRMVPPGASFHVKPKQKNWFEKIISDFADLFSQIYNGVKNAYNGLKAKLINTLAEGFGKVFGGKGFFEKVFTSIVDYGLVTIGLPPSLPNFDVLAMDSLDYLVRVAVDEAAKATGVPIDQLPDDLRSQVTSEMEKQFKNLRSRKTKSV